MPTILSSLMSVAGPRDNSANVTAPMPSPIPTNEMAQGQSINPLLNQLFGPGMTKGMSPDLAGPGALGNMPTTQNPMANPQASSAAAQTGTPDLNSFLGSPDFNDFLRRKIMDTPDKIASRMYGRMMGKDYNEDAMSSDFGKQTKTPSKAKSALLQILRGAGDIGGSFMAGATGHNFTPNYQKALDTAQEQYKTTGSILDKVLAAQTQAQWRAMMEQGRNDRFAQGDITKREIAANHESRVKAYQDVLAKIHQQQVDNATKLATGKLSLMGYQKANLDAQKQLIEARSKLTDVESYMKQLPANDTQAAWMAKVLGQTPEGAPIDANEFAKFQQARQKLYRPPFAGMLFHESNKVVNPETGMPMMYNGFGQYMNNPAEGKGGVPKLPSGQETMVTRSVAAYQAGKAFDNLIDRAGKEGKDNVDILRAVMGDPTLTDPTLREIRSTADSYSQLVAAGIHGTRNQKSKEDIKHELLFSIMGKGAEGSHAAVKGYQRSAAGFLLAEPGAITVLKQAGVTPDELKKIENSATAPTLVPGGKIIIGR